MNWELGDCIESLHTLGTEPCRRSSFKQLFWGLTLCISQSLWESSRTMGNTNRNAEGSYLLYRNSNKAIWNYWINWIVKFFTQDEMKWILNMLLDGVANSVFLPCGTQADKIKGSGLRMYYMYLDWMWQLMIMGKQAPSPFQRCRLWGDHKV